MKVTFEVTQAFLDRCAEVATARAVEIEPFVAARVADLAEQRILEMVNESAFDSLRDYVTPMVKDNMARAAPVIEQSIEKFLISFADESVDKVVSKAFLDSFGWEIGPRIRYVCLKAFGRGFLTKLKALVADQVAASRQPSKARSKNARLKKAPPTDPAAT